MNSRRTLHGEIVELRQRLAEAEDALRAIRSQEVDALVVTGPDGDLVFQLKGSDEPYRVLVETMRDGAATLLPDGVIAYSNQAFAGMLRFPLDRVIGEQFQHFVVPETGDLLSGWLRQPTEGKHRGEVTLLASDGTEIPAEVSISALPVGAAVGTCIVLRDISERKRAQADLRQMNQELERRVIERTDALQRVNDRLMAEIEERVTIEEHLRERTTQMEAANRELTAFSYSVAHDLRAPLRSIAGYSQILMEEHCRALNAEAQSYLRQVQGAAVRMGQLIDDLLSLAQVGRSPLVRTAIDLNSLVREVVCCLTPDYEGRQIQWKIAKLPLVLGDITLLRAVFQNLLSNAIKFTRPRAVAVIEVGNIEQDDQTTVFVRDNGVGFNMKYSGKLFGVFQRLHREDEFEGTGVGLAIVQRIIERHRGRIWAESELDAGASFYFTLENARDNGSRSDAMVAEERTAL